MVGSAGAEMSTGAPGPSSRPLLFSGSHGMGVVRRSAGRASWGTFPLSRGPPGRGDAFRGMVPHQMSEFHKKMGGDYGVSLSYLWAA